MERLSSVWPTHYILFDMTHSEIKVDRELHCFHLGSNGKIRKSKIFSFQVFSL